ncbi:MAG: S1 RNA-binding domain-containing protein [Gammaproteobacteria bacterium]|nr:S1 RNA-binding domain-containing protein [Gammaproteobacteria bacterium]MDE0611981.1 S1 RNA-binding domain-containing protein [Gammaproteobacteria bacterium]
MTALTGEAEIGQVYTGKVVKIVNFGAFVNLKPGKDGLVHISQIAEYRIESVEAELSEGQTVNVKVLDVDEQGRVKLTMKEVPQPQPGE